MEEAILTKSLRKSALEIIDYKKASEASIVSILWKDPELFLLHDIKEEDFLEPVWKTYFIIGNDLVRRHDKRVLDDITVGLHLREDEILCKKYEEYGGWDTIEQATAYVETENLEGYIKKNNKFKLLLNLLKNGFALEHKLKEFLNMSSEEIYEEYEAYLNDSFMNIETEDRAYSIDHKIDQLILDLDDGLTVGLPFYNSPMLTAETGGSLLGNVTLCGALSGVGKSSFARNILLPSIIEQKERIVFMINEEDLTKMQRELLVWVANNIFKHDIQKYIVRNGKYSDETKKILEQAKEWIKERAEYVHVISFQSFSTAKAIKIIRKYSALGVKHFVLDTFKNDAEGSNDKMFWMNMKNNMVKLYDVAKPRGKNIHLWVTFQLAKSSSIQRYYSLGNIGESKGIADVASTCIMIRNLFEDELEGGKKKLNVYKTVGNSKVPVVLDKDKHYQLIFIVKNREGASGDYQIVVEHDLSKNTYKEVGFTRVPTDF
jgi:hypothetical protein